ncbi:hypothetical protein CEE37_03680 [candidate division LCP-89 bacterium B3_LCP]|uniref:DUF4870 domain-containing protein n=1 Tax=candidate division LCP-89 bacterium B3_LCP TaxID=2012998 RepID=A0A532V3F8_UNCL8|nr:MAG: hypothetical protein CEE37_03680 [candidate division LCP-89 bacterium B3_LCP]
MNEENKTNENSEDTTVPYAEVQEDDANVKEEGKLAAILAYVPFLCFYALFFKKDNSYAFQHGKQGLAIFIIELAAVALRWDVLWNVLLFLCAAVAVWGMVTALRGDDFRLPIISDLLDQYQP